MGKQQPHLGIFWFAGPLAPGTHHRVDQPQLLAISVPVNEVPLVGGFRTMETGHIDAWPGLQRQHPFLRGHPYELFPRGRVNYLADDGVYLVLLDPALLRPKFMGLIDAHFLLPDSRRVLTDAHYTTRVKLGQPVTPKPAGSAIALC